MLAGVTGGRFDFRNKWKRIMLNYQLEWTFLYYTDFLPKLKSNEEGNVLVSGYEGTGLDCFHFYPGICGECECAQSNGNSCITHEGIITRHMSGLTSLTTSKSVVNNQNRCKLLGF